MKKRDFFVTAKKIYIDSSSIKEVAQAYNIFLGLQNEWYGVRNEKQSQDLAKLCPFLIVSSLSDICNDMEVWLCWEDKLGGTGRFFFFFGGGGKYLDLRYFFQDI